MLPNVSNGLVCSRCMNIPIWGSSFSIKLSVEDLNDRLRSMRCQLCQLFLDCFSRPSMFGKTSAQLYRSGSTLRFRGGGSPVLSICSLPGASRILLCFLLQYSSYVKETGNMPSQPKKASQVYLNPEELFNSTCFGSGYAGAMMRLLIIAGPGAIRNSQRE